MAAENKSQLPQEGGRGPRFRIGLPRFARRRPPDPVLLRRIDAISAPTAASAPAGGEPRDADVDVQAQADIESSPFEDSSGDENALASTAPELESEAAVRAVRIRLQRPSPFIAAVVALVAAVAFVGALTYFGARTFTRDAADARGADEALSFAQHSATLANGDAFAGYLQILRYADDPILRAKASTEEQRRNALLQLLYLNTNKLGSLALAERSGLVLASTDPSIASVQESEAFRASRANLGPANSDIILPDDGSPGYVEFAAPLRDADGTVWGFVYGRSHPSKLWASTLLASVDGSRNVIINSKGQYSAGVHEDLLRQSWRGRPLENGSVRATVAGVESICGLGAIGKDTQIDRGWSVASCFPTSLIQANANSAMGQQALVTLTGAVLAIVLAAGLLRVFIQPTAVVVIAAAASAPPDPEDAIVEGVVESVVEIVPALEAESPLEPRIVANVDALTLIAAYEDRNAQLSERLRNTVMARLMIASTQVDEAYKLASTDAERAETLHATAMQEFEDLRERELRAFGQELHPGLIRLGLPGALRALRKDLADVIDVTLEIDPLSDAAEPGEGRISIDNERRLVIYRLVRDATHAIAAMEMDSCGVTLVRDGDELVVAISSETAEAFNEGSFRAATLAVEAYAGSVTVEWGAGSMTITARMPAPQAEWTAPSYAGRETVPDDAAQSDEGEDESASIHQPGSREPAVPAPGNASRADGLDLLHTVADEVGMPPVVEPEGPQTPLADILGRLSRELEGLPIALTIAREVERAITLTMCGLIHALMFEAAEAAATAGASECAIDASISGNLITVVLTAESETPFDAAAIELGRMGVESADGAVDVIRAGNAFSVTAELPLPQVEDAPNIQDDDAGPNSAKSPIKRAFAITGDAGAELMSLPEILRGLTQRHSSDLDVRLDLDIGIPMLGSAPALALARIASDAMTLFADMGATRVDITARPNGGSVQIRLFCVTDGDLFDEDALTSSATIRGLGGRVSVEEDGDRMVVVTAEAPMGPSEERQQIREHTDAA